MFRLHPAPLDEAMGCDGSITHGISDKTLQTFIHIKDFYLYDRTLV